jgi:peptidoglycan/LPS O-acetylase OafA/YrhL
MDDTIEFNIHWLTVAGGVVVPLIVALVTKRYADSGIKSLINLVLSATVAAVATLVNDTEHIANEFWGALTVAWTTSISTYFGLWRRTIAPRIAEASREFGVGANKVIRDARDVAGNV